MEGAEPEPSEEPDPSDPQGSATEYWSLRPARRGGEVRRGERQHVQLL